MALIITEEELYLKVVSSGERTRFTQMDEYASRINDALLKSSSRLVLLDYRETYFNIPPTDAFNLVKLFEIKLKAFKEVKLAIVSNAKSEGIVSFWEQLCQKRNFQYMLFMDMDKAEKWLIAQ